MSAVNHVRFRWYFAVFSLSGVFSVTFSVVFAYVADITDDNDRTAAYGMVGVHQFYKTYTFLLANVYSKMFILVYS